jgi:hypothetical protein
VLLEECIIKPVGWETLTRRIKRNTNMKIETTKGNQDRMQTKSLNKTRTTPAATSFEAAGKPKAAPTREEIARRAYEIYVARGKQDGREADDWYQAERELSGKAHRNN